MSNRLAPPSYRVDPQQDIFKINTKTSKAKRIAFNVVSTIIFPIGLARVSRFCLGKLVGIPVLPAQIIFQKKRLDDIRKQNLRIVNSRTGFKDVRLTIETADRVKLDTMKILNPAQTNKAAHEQKWIVFFPPNGMAYEQLIPIATQISNDTGANIYLGNYRGVGYSQGSPSRSKDLILDGEAMVQYLHNHEKVPFKNMIVQGWSLGGAIATEVAAMHQEKDDCIKLCNERSFSSLFKEIKTILPAGTVLASIVYIVGWRFKPIKHWNSISEENKMVIYHKKDMVIPYKAGLYKAAKDAKLTDAQKAAKKQRQKQKAEKQPIDKNYPQDYKPKNGIRLRENYQPAHMVRLPAFSAYHDYLKTMNRWLYKTP